MVTGKQDTGKRLADPRQLDRLRKDVHQWNRWRKRYPDTPIRLEGADLEEADLRVANLVGANLERANLERANLMGAELHEANLVGAVLEGAILSTTNLEGANLRWVNLRGAELEGADLEGANLEGANLEGAELKGAHLVGAHLVGAHLEGANLELAHLEGADLEGAHLEGANLERANLEGANLEGANLEGVELERANLEGVDLSGAFFENGQPDKSIALRPLPTRGSNHIEKQQQEWTKERADLELRLAEQINTTQKQTETLDRKIKELNEAAENERDKYSSVFSGLQANVQSEQNKFEEIRDALEAAEGEFATKFNEIKTHLEQEQSALKNFQAGLISGLEDQTGKLANSLDEKIRNALEGVHAQGILKDAADLWEEKRKAHTWVCTILFIAFVTLVLAAIALGVLYSENILSFIKATNIPVAPDQTTSGKPAIEQTQVGSVTTILTRVLLISLPIGLIIWIFRALLRIALLNLTLREDAAQRCVMVRTYVNLVGAGSADDVTDRGLILSAIFRPLPNEQGPEIAPPNLTDLIKPKKSN